MKKKTKVLITTTAIITGILGINNEVGTDKLSVLGVNTYTNYRLENTIEIGYNNPKSGKVSISSLSLDVVTLINSNVSSINKQDETAVIEETTIEDETGSVETTIEDETGSVETTIEDETGSVETSVQAINATKIRCTVYCDVGYTFSGEWTREGIVAGKEEWIGKHCNLYRVNEDGTMGDLIGTYDFLDTGYGINGSLINGTSIDVWRPTLDKCWEWVGDYGDYVYMEMID